MEKLITTDKINLANISFPNNYNTCLFKHGDKLSHAAARKKMCDTVRAGEGWRGCSTIPWSKSNLETAPMIKSMHPLHASGTSYILNEAMSSVGSAVSGHVDRDLAHADHMVWVADLPYVHFGNLTPLSVRA